MIKMHQKHFFLIFMFWKAVENHERGANTSNFFNFKFFQEDIN